MNGAFDDHASRGRIRDDLDATIVVEAGAGTGKTRALVGRVVRLVLAAGVPIGRIAAITFTEAAAAELRDRVRHALEHARGTRTWPETRAPLDEAHVARLEGALSSFDDATLTTLHGFAQRILSEYPLEAGLPPTFEVLDEVGALIAFSERWREHLDALYGDPAMETILRRAVVAGLEPARLAEIALGLRDQWHRLDAAAAGLGAPPSARVDVAGVLGHLDAALACTPWCTAPDDLLLAHLESLRPYRDLLATAVDDEDRIRALRAEITVARGKTGRQNNWGGQGIGVVRDELVAAEAARSAALASVRDGVFAALFARLAAAAVGDARVRRRTGELEFHDLLVLARDLLRDHAPVRRALHERFERILIDEFQDTDPLQIEIAVLLAADPGAPVGEWWETPVTPGRLFVVGDPKQSIYRFRHADIALYQRVLDRFESGHTHLTECFRCAPGIVAWVNHVFETQMGTGAPGTQASYVPLRAARQVQDPVPRVTLLGGPTSDPLDVVREREADDIAATVRRVVADGWPVSTGGDATRPARLGDVAVLLPARTTLRPLEDAFQDAGVPYRLESRSLIFSTAEVRDITAVLHAVDDPTDEVAVVAALRSPAFACRDDELRAYHEAGGPWDYRVPPPSTGPVGAALSALHDLHERRHWETVSSLVEGVISDRHLAEIALQGRRHRDRWRRQRFVVDQARAFCDAGGSRLRDFIAWMDRQAEEGAQVNELVVPETDDDAVRVLTVHGAKGLEFPVVVLAGLNAEPSRTPPRVLWHDGLGVQAGLGPQAARFSTASYELALGAEGPQASSERVRLLYVAMTRAADHLVVSVHHRTGAQTDAAALVELADRRPELWRRPDPQAPAAPVAAEVSPPVEGPGDPLAEREAWARRRADLIQAGRRAPTVAATALTPPDGRVPPATPWAAAEDPGDEGWVEATDPPRRRGRAGTSLGRAVHAVLQTVEFGDDGALDGVALAQAVAEGIGDRVSEVRRLARAALDAPVVRAAVSGRHWRELYVAAPLEGVLVEGFVDLLGETADGLVVVDYKTDRVSDDDAGITALLGHYRLQMGAYAAVLEATLGRPVARAVLVLVGSGQAVERDVEDLPGAVREVRHRLREGLRSAAGG